LEKPKAGITTEYTEHTEKNAPEATEGTEGVLALMASPHPINQGPPRNTQNTRNEQRWDRLVQGAIQ